MSMEKKTHPYLTGSGAQREYEWVTEARCLVCNELGTRANGVLGVVGEPGGGGTLTCECLNCGHTTYEHAASFRAHYPPPKPVVAQAAAGDEDVHD